jgi:exosortase/archaeosortase family protein
VGWLETHAVLPLTQLQGRIAERGFGAPALPIDVTLACSGADALALCAGAILAYPSTWRLRLAGLSGGIALILILNTIRIGVLGRAAGSSVWFTALHLYAWPAVLMLTIAGYVFGWMRFADSRHRGGMGAVHSAPLDGATPGTTGLTRKFVALAAAFLVLFTVAAPWYLHSAVVLAVAGLITRVAATVLTLVGVQSTATGTVLSTSRGAFLVTQECVATPLIPLYLAAAVAYGRTYPQRAVALLAAVPLFVVLGIARLLVVALPPAMIGSPLYLVHAFYQVLVAIIVVFLAATWRHGAGATAWRRALLGGFIGAVFVYLLGPSYTRALASAYASGPVVDDPQGAIALLPGFQIGLYIALCLVVAGVARWQLFVTGFAVLGLAQLAAFAALHFVVGHWGLSPHVRDVRAWALGGPLVIVAAVVTYARPRR